jgi:hypothetical protein
VGRAVGDDDTDQRVGWHGFFDGAEEADELRTTMALHTTANHFAVRHVEGR